MVLVPYKSARLFDRLIHGERHKAWQQFAKSQCLHFKDGGFFSQDIITGDFLGHFLSIRLASDEEGEFTIFELKRKLKFDYFEKRHSHRDIMERFWEMYNIIQSGISLEITSEQIYFKSEEYIKSKNKFQSISEQLANLIEIFPGVCKLGGVAIDSIIQIEHFKPITGQISVRSSTF